MAHVARAAFDLNGFSAEYVELSGAEPYDFRSRGENHYLALHDITLTDGELRVDGLPTLHKKDLRDTITFVPKGCGIEGWHTESGPGVFEAVGVLISYISSEQSIPTNTCRRPSSSARSAPWQTKPPSSS